MKIIATTLMNRSNGKRLPILGIAAVLSALLLSLVLGPSSKIVQATSTTWTATLTSVADDNNDQWGYELDDFGRMTDTTFVHSGVTYTIEDLKWDEFDEHIEFVVDNCLKPSDFTSLAIDSTTYTDPDFIKEDDCESYPTDLQRFRFHDVSSNPLTEENDYEITITLSETSSTPDTSTSSCLTQLEPTPGTPLETSGTWNSDCDSENRSGSNAKYYSFILGHQGEVDIVLKAPTSRDPYMYLLQGAGTSGSVIERDDDGAGYPNSQITRELSPGTYTIEATTYASNVTGDFTLTITVTAPTAERVASTTVQFGRSLTSPKGLAWDGSQLFLVDDGTDALYTVATSTGVATRVSATTTRFGLSASVEPRGLAWDGSTLYMITQSRLYTLDRTTGVATPVGLFGTDISGATGLAWKRSLTATSTGETGKPAPGRLYMVDSGEDALYIVDTATGSASPTDAFAVDSSVSESGDTVRIPRGLSWVGSDLYMVSSLPGNTYLLDETAGTVINLGPLGIEEPTDLAWDGSRLFVLDEDTNALYTISGIGLPEPPPASSGYQTKQVGSAVQFGLTDVTLDSPRGLTMVGADLYMVEDNTDFLYTVNRATGVAGKVGSAGLATSTIQTRGLAWDGTTMYMATPNSLYTVNRAYGTATRVGSFGTGITDAFGLAWDGTTLYMVDRRTDALYTVATSTGAASRVNSNAPRFNNPSGLTWVTSGSSRSYYYGDDELTSLYMGDANGYLYKVNKDTGYATYVTWLGTDDITGLAWFDETSTLYFADDTSDALHTVTNFPGFLPNTGDLYYNGSNFADGFVRWDNPSWVLSFQCQTDPLKCSTYEHDLTLEWKASGGWFDYTRSGETGRYPFNPFTAPFCTAWSDLPMGFDDCPTAGVLAAPDLVELSFGTFKASLIEGGHDYYGFWVFKNQRGAGSTTEVKLYGQEGKYGRGRWENIHCYPVRAEWAWCVEGRQQASMLESGTTWSYGTSSYTTYSRP